jgi:transposase
VRRFLGDNQRRINQPNVSPLLCQKQQQHNTSKTVSWTGEIKKIGGSRIIEDADGNRMDRDLNGARGIFLRALVDTPWLKSFLAI